MVEQAGDGNGTRLWVGLLTAASATTTLALACATPFSALAAVAATRMSARGGFALMALTWAASQAIGFGVLGYPHDPRTLGWAVAILTAGLVSVGAARWGSQAVARTHPAVQVATAFGTGFVGYKLTLLGWAILLGGVHTALSPYWSARQFGREALILTGVVALYHLLVAAGVPAARQRPQPA